MQCSARIVYCPKRGAVILGGNGVFLREMNFLRLQATFHKTVKWNFKLFAGGSSHLSGLPVGRQRYLRNSAIYCSS